MEQSFLIQKKPLSLFFQFPLVSRSGRIRKLLLESKDTKNAYHLNLTAVPGGSEAFELAAKFCYGVVVQFNSSNIAALRCVAHYLEMTEDLSEKNLEGRTESYLKDTILSDISNSITVLHSTERLLPAAEEISLVGRLVNAIAVNACKEQLASGLLKLDQKFGCVGRTEKPSDCWWGKSLLILKLDFFHRVVSAMKSKGLNQEIISDILMSYARKSLQIIREPSLVKGNGILDSDLQKKQRIVLEAIVGLLPTQANKSSIPISFLSSLLKTAIGSGTSVSCRSDLERRISHQLDQAILEDILIPANVGAMYDTDSVQRIFSMFLNLDECDYRDDDEDGDLADESEMAMYDFDGPESPKQSSIFKVSKLMDSYLAEVALDSNLPPSKFTALAELLPDHARVVCDGLYRAVDIFLKVIKIISKYSPFFLFKILIFFLQLGSSEHERFGALPSLQDNQLPETVTGRKQPRGAERETPRPDRCSGTVLRTDAAQERHDQRRQRHRRFHSKPVLLVPWTVSKPFWKRDGKRSHLASGQLRFGEKREQRVETRGGEDEDEAD